jgi:hypothetical protein
MSRDATKPPERGTITWYGYGSSHLRDLADEMNALVASCHERVPCPTCGAPIGERCCAMPLGWGGVCAQVGVGRTLKHPHPARWRQEVPPR